VSAVLLSQAANASAALAKTVNGMVFFMI